MSDKTKYSPNILLKYSCIGIFLLCFSPLFAQMPLFFEQISIKEGLPHNAVYDIKQDHNGFMWFGTRQGLVRYDGYRFYNINHIVLDKDYLLTSINSIFIDSQQRLWVGTETQGVFVLEINKNKWHKIYLNAEVQFPEITTFFEDNQHNVWIGSIQSGCFLLSKDGVLIQHFQTAQGLGGNSVFDFSQDEQNKIWIAASGMGINCYNTQTQKIEHFIPANNSNKINTFRKVIHLNKDGILWIGAQTEGVFTFDTNTNTFQNVDNELFAKLKNTVIADIIEKENGELWFATDGNGLFAYYPTLEKIQHEIYNPRSNRSLNTNNLLRLFMDKNQNIWVATFNGGINIWKKHKTYFPTHQEWTNTDFTLSNQSILSICKTANQEVWVGTDGGGIDIWNITKQQWRHLSTPQFPSGKVVKTIFEDSKKNLWIGYFNMGLDKYNPATGQLQHFRRAENSNFNPNDDNVWSIAEDLNGNIWIGTLGGGLNCFHPANQTFNHFDLPSNSASLTTNDAIFSLLCVENTLWVGTKNSGIFIIDLNNNQVKHLVQTNATNSLAANDIRCIFKDSKGRIWVGTESGGLHQWLGNDTFRRIGTQEGLLSNVVMSIEEGNDHTLWCSSFQGLSHFNPENSVVINYDFHNAAYNNQFNHIASAKLDDGTLCFGGINGINIIQDKYLAQTLPLPKVMLSELKILNKSILANDKSGILHTDIAHTNAIILDYTQNLCTIDFSALDYTSPIDIRYAYQLEGLDKTWHYITAAEPSVTYNLSPGAYTFKVFVVNGSSNDMQNNITTLKINVTPPFWKTIWFNILVVCSLILIGIVLFNLYTQRQEERWNAKTIAQEKEILHLQNENLAKEIEGKTNELMSKALQMGHKNEMMQNIMEILKTLKTEQTETNLKKIRTLEKIVTAELQDEDNWQQLNVYFDKVNQNFTERLIKAFPNLTQNDLRLCILIKLNLSAKEMANLLNVSVPGIEKGKYRLKKRLNLSVEEDLNEFLRGY